MQLTSKQKYQLRCIRSLSVSKYYQHIQQYGFKCPENAVSWGQIDYEIEQTLKFGANFLFHDSVQYPIGLKHIVSPPPVLVYKGNINLLNKLCIAIVGSRQASLQALTITKQLAQELSTANQTIVSGLAIGIDTYAHRYAQSTIAVLGCGINVFYPLENQQLQMSLSTQHLVLTEYPFNMSVKKEHFPARNRIISGLSWGIVIVEAAYSSGSMITAKHALAQGKEVFAVPSHPLDLSSQGGNWLIKQGACLIQTSQDVLQNMPTVLRVPIYNTTLNETMMSADVDIAENEVLQAEESIQHVEFDVRNVQKDKVLQTEESMQCAEFDVRNVQKDDLTDHEINLLNLLSCTPVSINQLSREIDMPMLKLKTMITKLELQDLIKVDSYFNICKSI